MTETLLLRMPEPGQLASWLLVDAIGNRIGRVQIGTLTEAATHADGRRLCALVPGNAVTITHVDIPSRSLQKVSQAVPFALEDRLAEDVESLHFAVSPHTGGGYTVAIISRAHIQRWLDELLAIGLEPAELIPDMLALPLRDDTLVMALEGDQVLTRFPDGSGFVSDLALAPLLIQKQLAILAATSVCAHALIHTADQSAAQRLADSLVELNLEISYAPLRDNVLTLMATNLQEQHATNLLQGTFNRRGGFVEHWRRWRMTAYLLVSLLVLGVVQQGASYFQLRHAAASLDLQVLALFHAAAPDIHRELDWPSMRIVLQQRLKQLTGGGDNNDLLSLLTASGATIQAQNGIQLSSFSYRSGSLQLQIQAPDIDTLNSLKLALAQNTRLSVNLDSVNSTNGQATARLTITGSGT